MRNPPEAYRLQHFDKPTQINRKEIGKLMKDVKRKHTVRSYLLHCTSVDDALESLSFLRKNCKELFHV